MITQTQAKIYLQIKDSSYDSLLGEIIPFCVSYIEKYVNRTLSYTTKTETLQGTGRQFLPLNDINIKDVTSVKVDDIELSSTDYSIKNDMLFRKDLWEKVYRTNTIVDYNIEVSYSCGYAYPTITNTVNTGDVPKELQYVALELMKRIFIRSGTQQQVTTEQGSQKSASMSTTYFETRFTEDIPKDLKRILDKYKKVGV